MEVSSGIERLWAGGKASVGFPREQAGAETFLAGRKKPTDRRGVAVGSGFSGDERTWPALGTPKPSLARRTNPST